MAADLKKHNVTKGFIDRFWENLLKVGKDKITQTYLKTRLALLEGYWQRYEAMHFELAGSEDPAAILYMKGDAFSSTEDSYVSTKTRITSMIKDDDPTPKLENPDPATPGTRHVQLPKISLPTFAGDQLAWEGFRDLFRSIVGDVPDLGPAQKLQYLKLSLSGEAAAAIANVEMSDNGYELAWAELTARYDNKRVLLAAHMRTFLNSPTMTKPSPTGLKQLSSTALQARRSFESLGRPVAHWDDWFVHIMVEKMDASSRLFWEASLETSSEFPTLTKLQDFLQTRIRALEAVNFKLIPQPTTVGKADRKQKVNILAASATGKSAKRCVICQGNHLFNYCARFKDLTVPQRRDHVRKQGACFNCLKLQHTVSNCPSGLCCLRCGDRHHTLLHQSDNSSGPDTDASAKTAKASDPTGSDTPTATPAASKVAALTSAAGNQVLLSTAQLICFSPKGGDITIRALLDSGSEASFVTEQIAQRLGLVRRRVHVPVSRI